MFKLLTADLAEIELRVLAHMSKIDEDGARSIIRETLGMVEARALLLAMAKIKPLDATLQRMVSQHIQTLDLIQTHVSMRIRDLNSHKKEYPSTWRAVNKFKEELEESIMLLEGLLNPTQGKPYDHRRSVV